MDMDGSAIKRLILFKTFVSRVVGGVMKWPFPQAGGNACECSLGIRHCADPARRKRFTASAKSEGLVQSPNESAKLPQGFS
jgi:hypothetical protein